MKRAPLKKRDKSLKGSKTRANLGAVYPGMPDRVWFLEIDNAVYDLLYQLQCEEEARRGASGRYRVLPMDPDILDAIVVNDNDPPTVLIKRDDMESMLAVLAQLSEVQQRRVRAYIEGLTFAKIARIENVDINSVRESVRSALSKMAKILR